MGIGSYGKVEALGALLAGLVIRNLSPQEQVKELESNIKTITYSLFGPVFFLWVGADTNVSYLIAYPLLIALVIGVSYSSKLLASYLVARKELGQKRSIILGISLGVRFSTSIVVIKFLFEKALIGLDIYSVLIASTIAFKFIIPFLLAMLITRWKIAPKLK
jgi:Kef-type K+ transport system membrane component KefB